MPVSGTCANTLESACANTPATCFLYGAYSCEHSSKATFLHIGPFAEIRVNTVYVNTCKRKHNIDNLYMFRFHSDANECIAYMHSMFLPCCFSFKYCFKPKQNKYKVHRKILEVVYNVTNYWVQTIWVRFTNT